MRQVPAINIEKKVFHLSIFRPDERHVIYAANPYHPAKVYGFAKLRNFNISLGYF